MQQPDLDRLTKSARLPDEVEIKEEEKCTEQIVEQDSGTTAETFKLAELRALDLTEDRMVFNPAKATLPELLAHQIEECLVDRTKAAEAHRGLYLNYHAHMDVDNRQQSARAALKTAEDLKMLSELLYQDLLRIVSGDLNG